MAKPRETESSPDDDDGITKEDILQWIRTDVWKGEEDEEELALMIQENLGDEDEVDEAWLAKAIRITPFHWQRRLQVKMIAQDPMRSSPDASSILHRHVRRDLAARGAVSA